MAVRRAVLVARKEAVGIDSSDKGALSAKELATERSSSLTAFGSYLSRQRNYLSSFNPAQDLLLAILIKLLRDKTFYVVRWGLMIGCFHFRIPSIILFGIRK